MGAITKGYAKIAFNDLSKKVIRDGKKHPAIVGFEAPMSFVWNKYNSSKTFDDFTKLCSEDGIEIIDFDIKADEIKKVPTGGMVYRKQYKTGYQPYLLRVTYKANKQKDKKKGHSLIAHILLCFIMVGLFTIPYYSISKKHYWHA